MHKAEVHARGGNPAKINVRTTLVTLVFLGFLGFTS